MQSAIITPETFGSFLDKTEDGAQLTIIIPEEHSGAFDSLGKMLWDFEQATGRKKNWIMYAAHPYISVLIDDGE